MSWIDCELAVYLPKSARYTANYPYSTFILGEYMESFSISASHKQSSSGELSQKSIHMLYLVHVWKLDLENSLIKSGIKKEAASTQNQALNAVLFLYRHVLKQSTPSLSTYHQDYVWISVIS